MVRRQVPLEITSCLTVREADVLRLALEGKTMKTAAYELGLSAPLASHCLGRAAIKLGVKSSRELLRAAAISSTQERPSLPSTLTPCEREVLRLVGLGWTNMQIAALRARSQRTIANQIASLLRKTNLASRRALMAMYPEHDRPPSAGRGAPKPNE